MTLNRSVFAAIGLAASALASSAQAAATSLEALRWKARPVVVFAPERSPASGEQINWLRKAAAILTERDMPVFVVGPGGVTTLAGDRAALDAARLRMDFGVESDAFAIILVGKDGGEKFRAAAPVEVARLIDLVDAMPMRRQEAR